MASTRSIEAMSWWRSARMLATALVMAGAMGSKAYGIAGDAVDVLAPIKGHLDEPLNAKAMTFKIMRDYPEFFKKAITI